MTTIMMHSPESLAAAVVIPHGNWVQLDDPLFLHHGMGPRYVQANTVMVAGRPLSYAMLDLPETSYDLITSDDQPVDLGTFDELAKTAEGELYLSLDMAFTHGNRTKHFATKQQMALALIKAKAEGISLQDQLAMYRIARWARQYEKRAWWICKHWQQAVTCSFIDWEGLGI